ncbi:hypothetical protein FB556_2075 [Enteractinococcus coprophilus]|uniref:Uncharacterized protein n=1 Tax=Enteractinococcus coprophilus TaxID=1027633 RepID=A0A543AGA0_9MICC|nr:hypothetical protein FB556_2075 [Enteractinococcus coprophilus]
MLKTRAPVETGGPDTHHSHLEEVVTTIVFYPGNYLRIPVNSLRVLQSLQRLNAPAENLRFHPGRSLFTHTLRYLKYKHIRLEKL